MVALAFGDKSSTRFGYTLPKEKLNNITKCEFSSKKNAPTTTTMSVEEQIQFKKLQETQPPTPPQQFTTPFREPPDESRLGYLASSGDLPSLMRLLEVFLQFDINNRNTSEISPSNFLLSYAVDFKCDFFRICSYI